MPLSKDKAQEYQTAMNWVGWEVRHWKGGLYTVYGVSVKEDTLDVLVHYYSQEKGIRWTRLLSDFTAEVTDPSQSQVWRFIRMRKASDTQMLAAVGLNALHDKLEKFIVGMRGVLSLTL